MKVQVTKSQFIETDDIQFAEAAGWSDRVTLVYLRERDGYVQIDTDYEQFVRVINKAVNSQYHPGYIHHLTS